MSFAAWREAIGNDAPDLLEFLGSIKAQGGDHDWLEHSVALPFLRRLAGELREARMRESELGAAFTKADRARELARLEQYALQAQHAAVIAGPVAPEFRSAPAALAEMVAKIGRTRGELEQRAADAAVAWVQARKQVEAAQARIASMPTTAYDAIAAKALRVDVDALGASRRVCDCRGDGSPQFPIELELVDGLRIAIAGARR